MEENNERQNMDSSDPSADNNVQSTNDNSKLEEPQKSNPPKPVSHIKHMKEIAIASVAIAVLATFALVAVLVMNKDDGAETVNDTLVEQEEEKLIELASAVTIVEGSVEKSEDGSTWSAIAAGDTLAVGEYLRTLSASRAVMLLDDGSAVRLDENSQIKLSVSDANATDIMLIDGGAYARVVESETRTFAVVTESERFIAQGTAYSTSTDGEKDELEVYQSKVLVDSENVDIEEGNKYDTDSKKKTSLDLDKLEDDDFIAWNREQDEKNSKFKDKLGVLDIKEEVKEETPAPAPITPPADPTPSAPPASISLTGSVSDKGINLNWSLNNGASALDGFKIVYDKNAFLPVYGTHTSQYVGKGNLSSFVKLQDGNTYNLRICAYRPAAGSCDTYSNTVTVTAPIVEVEQVQAGAVTLSISGQNLNWSFAGTAPHGFKVVLNSTGSPVYPANSIEYLGKGTTSYKLPEKPVGEYFVKICKYTADSTGCTDYSNEVVYTVE